MPILRTYAGVGKALRGLSQERQRAALPGLIERLAPTGRGQPAHPRTERGTLPPSPMPETSLPERIAPALSAAELRLDEVDVPLRARRREIAGRLALAAADIVAVTAALLIVSVLPVIEARFTAWILAFIPLFALLAKAAGLYDRDQVVLHKTTLDEAPVLVAVAAIFALLVEGMQALAYNGASHPLPLWAVLIVTLVVARALARLLDRAPHGHGAGGGDRRPGDRRTGRPQDRRRPRAERHRGRPRGRPGRTATTATSCWARMDQLPAVLERHRIERAIVASTQAGGEDVADVVRATTACGVRVAVFPRMLEVIGTSVEFDDLGGQVLLGVRGFGLTPSSRLLKRAFDLIVAVGDAGRARPRAGPDRGGHQAHARGARWSSTRPAWGGTGASSGCSSSARWSAAPTRERARCSTSTRPGPCSRSPTTHAPHGSGASCAGARWTSCLSS